jgi:hypothetical protein
VCTLGLTYLVPPEDLIAQLPDGVVKECLQQQEEAYARGFAFTYGVTHTFVEANASVGHLLRDAVKYPVEHGVGKSLADGYEALTGFAAKVRDFPVSRLNEISVKAVAEPLEKLADGLGAAVELSDPRAFAEREGETLAERLKRLDAKHEAVVELRQATELAEKLTGELVAALAGPGELVAAGRGARVLTAGKRAADWGADTAVDLARQQSRAAMALRRYRSLERRAQLTDVDLPDDLPRVDLGAEVRALDELFDRQHGLNLQLAAARDERLAELALKEFNDPPARVFEPPEPVRLDGTAMDIDDARSPLKLGSGGFSDVYMHPDDPGLVVKIGTDRMPFDSDTPTFDAMVDRQLSGARVLDGHGTVDMPDGRSYTAITQEAVPDDRLVSNIIDRQGGMPHELQEEIVRIMHRANERGYVFGDMKPSNIYAEQLADGGWRVGFMDLDFIARIPDDFHLTAHEVQWTQTTGRMVLPGGNSMASPEMSLGVVSQVTEGGTVDAWRGGLSDDLVELVGDPQRARAHFGSPEYLARVASREDMAAAVRSAQSRLDDALAADERFAALSDEFAAGRQELSQHLDAFERGHRERAAALERAAGETPERRPPGGRGGRAARPSGVAQWLEWEPDAQSAGTLKGLGDVALARLSQLECVEYLRRYHAGCDRKTLKALGSPCGDDDEEEEDR